MVPDVYFSLYANGIIIFSFSSETPPPPKKETNKKQTNKTRIFYSSLPLPFTVETCGILYISNAGHYTSLLSYYTYIYISLSLLLLLCYFDCWPINRYLHVCVCVSVCLKDKKKRKDKNPAKLPWPNCSNKNLSLNHFSNDAPFILIFYFFFGT